MQFFFSVSFGAPWAPTGLHHRPLVEHHHPIVVERGQGGPEMAGLASAVKGVLKQNHRGMTVSAPPLCQWHKCTITAWRQSRVPIPLNESSALGWQPRGSCSNRVGVNNTGQDRQKLLGLVGGSTTRDPLEETALGAENAKKPNANAKPAEQAEFDHLGCVGAPAQAGTLPPGWGRPRLGIQPAAEGTHVPDLTPLSKPTGEARERGGRVGRHRQPG